MRIKKLQFQGFRNLCKHTVEFSDHLNCIFGENGSGKTNLLEAISFLSTGKSFRKKSTFSQILNIDGQETEVLLSSLVTHNKIEKTLGLKINQEKYHWFLNGYLVARRPKMIPIVFIGPFDSYEFFNSSSFRRRWIDTKISSLKEEYKKALGKYNSFIKHKNKLLSLRPDRYREQIKSLNKSIAPISFFLTQERKIFLQELAPWISKAFAEIFFQDSNLDITLKSPLSFLSEKGILKLLDDSMGLDESLGHTKCGGHGDDYLLFFNGLPVKEFCSLGQQRVGILALIFAYVRLFEYKLNTLPIVLIDDVSGELDKIRWGNFIDYLQERECQIFMTTANEFFKKELEKIGHSKHIEIQNGLLV